MAADPLLIFSNPDKQTHANKGKEPEYMPKWPWRLLACGPPGCGKRNLILNVISKLNPRASSIDVVHIDPESEEYKMLEDFGGEARTKPYVTYYTPDAPPTFKMVGNENDDDLGGQSRPLLIIDETPTKMLKRSAQSEIERLCGYGSTHKNMSICFSFQNFTDVLPNVRRLFNNFAIWPTVDNQVVQLAANKVGVPPEELEDLLSLCVHPTDFIWVDATVPQDSEWRFRLNFTVPITRI